ncbi:MAG: MarR family transcriptional regulator [Gammaproteobacteria bacterium]|nr:MarR family transcriptional regulator [Gammaproteobacteria bacterium]
MNDLVDDLVGAWAEERPELNCDALEAVVRIQLLGKLLSESAEEALEEHGLKLWEYDVLSALRRQGKPYVLAPSDLARESLLTSGTITTRIDRLQDRGLVERTRDATDRRAVRIRLTREGKRVIDTAVATRVDRAERQLACLSNRELDTLASKLRKILRNSVEQQPVA